MHLALAEISIVPVFAGRITSAPGLGGRFQFRPLLATGDLILE